ncbi:MAG TPA: four-carbon acid sugar kinase family protein [Roseiarcus sp.]|nr:four-carbon acid sugar kinase family protein [Roseiarcus sp.]
MSEAAELPAGLLLAFYGDDFTGSSAVMEVMTFAGLPAVMFMAPPSPAQLARFSGYRAIGVASVARAQPPSWMDAHLPEAFAALAALDAPVTQYKICSTLDSSPTIGSIGRAIDIGAPIFGAREGAAQWLPLVVAAPGIRRYQAFGNLFAAHAESVYRLDRHPVMRAHPVTPMREADVRLHIAQQTARPIGLVDCLAMKDGSGFRRLQEELRAGRSIVALDIVDDETLRWVGAVIWRNRGKGVFAVGSQGIEYALIAHWRACGALPESRESPSARRVPQIVAASGSVSANTAAQIEWAEANGFEIVALDASAAVDAREWRRAVAAAIDGARAALSAGRSPLVVTARGPQDRAVAAMRAKLASGRSDPLEANARIGEGLGEVVAEVARQAKLPRGAISGGDTSGFAMRALGGYALEAVAPLAPGSPLCRVFSSDSEIDGFEIALKGGQMGAPDFFGSVRAGCAIS